MGRGVDQRSLRRALAILFLAPLLPAAGGLEGQDAEIVGRVTDRSSGQPVEDVAVELSDTDYHDVTSPGGVFRITGVPRGQYILVVDYLGMRARGVPVEVDRGGKLSLDVILELQVVPVSSLEVTVSGRPEVGKLYGFYKRSAEGLGHFITRSEIQDQNPPRTTALFRRVPGIEVGRPQPSGRAVVRMRRRNNCTPAIYLDGIRTPYFDVNSLQPIDIAGIEVYRGNSEVPAQFNYRVRCGVIVIWTRDPSNAQSFE